jgi:aspartokinase/homoserine dehydrogenase 1
VEALGKVIEILKHKKGVQVAVASAFSGMTDSLIAAAHKAQSQDPRYDDMLQSMQDRHLQAGAHFLQGEDFHDAQRGIEAGFKDLGGILASVKTLGELSPRSLDRIMSFGEELSASLLARILNAGGVRAEYLDAKKLVRTNDAFGKAKYQQEETFSRIQEFFQSRKNTGLIYCVPGFIGAARDGAVTTLGRGGSDLTAAIFGAALQAEEIEIWTDVDGVMTADPRLVKNAFTINELSYVEAMELSYFGAKVLYAPTIEPAMEGPIPLRILNTFNPAGPGTRITGYAEPGAYPIRGISSMPNVALARIQGSGMVGVAGFSSRLFGALSRQGINVILITQSSSEYSICFAILPEDAEKAEAAISKEFFLEIQTGEIDQPIIEGNFAILAVVGSQMKRSPGVSGRVFHALGRNGINIVAIAQGSSELNISAVLARPDEAKAVNAVHEAFFLAGVRSVNLFLAGTGLIGGTLLDQLSDHRESLEKEHQVRINLAGVANSRYMAFDPQGLDPQKAKTLLKSEVLQPGAQAFSLSAFLEGMRALNLPNTAFCDCTADDLLAAQYGAILESSIPIVTPNKRANSGSLEYYRKLTGLAKTRGIPYLYEVTVCAGLPVISTLRDLFLSGDKVRRIEAVVSGTLSYIFNNYDGKKPFSALVREAHAKGYTEPDPRDDLNAMDAARKALILARECGMPLEFDSVEIEPLLPKACFDAPSVPAFFAELEKADAGFEERRSAAVREGKALRYIAVIEAGRARLSLRAEPAESPFRNLVDADNMVVIRSDRYSTLPMVIKGPGAGAQVTAGGVLADIVRIARTLV